MIAYHENGECVCRDFNKIGVIGNCYSTSRFVQAIINYLERRPNEKFLLVNSEQQFSTFHRLRMRCSSK